MSELIRTVTFSPSTSDEATILTFILQGPRGAITLRINTHWTPTSCSNNAHFPEALSIDKHSPVPLYDGAGYCNSCPFLDGKPCFSDGSALCSREYLDTLITRGTDGLWPALGEWYDTLPLPPSLGAQGAD